jgi:hypothetical protein
MNSWWNTEFESSASKAMRFGGSRAVIVTVDLFCLPLRSASA